MPYIISSGESSEGIVLENDTMTVLDSGVAMTTTVNSEGRLYVSSGGTANSTTVNKMGEMYVSSSGLADETNTSRDVYADSAYRSAEHEAELKALKFRAHLQRKGCRGRPLTSWEKQGNRTRSKTRSRIEHVFGAMVQRAGNVILRTIGIKAAEVKLGLRNLAVNNVKYKLIQPPEPSPAPWADVCFPIRHRAGRSHVRLKSESGRNKGSTYYLTN